jgi:hypothetical protein
LTSPFGTPAAISASMAARTVSGVCAASGNTRYHDSAGRAAGVTRL